MDGSLLINMLACDLPLKCIQQNFFILRKNKKYSNIQERRQGFLITFFSIKFKRVSFLDTKSKIIFIIKDAE